MATTTVNDALVELNNVIDATNYLLEELKTRKDQFLQRQNLIEDVKVAMESTDFRNDIIFHIRTNYGEGIAREVAFFVMEKIDADIEEFINARVKTAIEQLNSN
jgi:hypothetical protein